MLSLLPEEARVMVDEPGLLCTVEEEDQEEELLELECFDRCLISWPVAMRHSRVCMCCGNVWVVEKPGRIRRGERLDLLLVFPEQATFLTKK